VKYAFLSIFYHWCVAQGTPSAPLSILMQALREMLRG